MSSNVRFPDAAKSFLTRNSSCTNETIMRMVTHNPSRRLLAGSCMVAGLHELGTMNTPTQPFYPLFDHSEGVVEREEVVDAASGNHVEKKRRLTSEQVKSLEVSFDLESKLEPERKNQLAEDLGLHPRQVAIWFQNRRARYKTKQLERDYDQLKAQYEAVIAENERLQEEVTKLNQLLGRERISKEENDSTSQVTVNTEEEETQNVNETDRPTSHSLHLDDVNYNQKQKDHEICSGTYRTSEEVLDTNNHDKEKNSPHAEANHIGKSPLERLYNALYMHQIAVKVEDGYCTQEDLYSNGFFTVDEHPPMLSLDWS